MNYTQRSKLIDRLCGAGLMLICFEILYSMIGSALKSNYNYHDVTMWVNVIGGIILLIGIAILVYAYIKKSGLKASYGLELIVFAFSAPLVLGSRIDFEAPFNLLHIIFPIVFLFYYIGKAIYIVSDIMKPDKNSKKKKSKKKKR